mmetsp:Transcript_66823/g.131085  ORF Transcript_66823/g.131085 Transcript_66823/m.131085 type:complete len:108 (-) Transcript_66823:72-395(-)
MVVVVAPHASWGTSGGGKSAVSVDCGERCPERVGVVGRLDEEGGGGEASSIKGGGGDGVVAAERGAGAGDGGVGVVRTGATMAWMWMSMLLPLVEPPPADGAEEMSR